VTRSRALVIEHQPLGMWTATNVDASSGEPIQQFTLDDGPGREATGNELKMIAESLASDLGPVDAVIYLAEHAAGLNDFAPRLISGYPLPVWIVHPAVAIANTVPLQHERFIVLDFAGGGSALLLKRCAGGGVEDLMECEGDLRRHLSRKGHRQVIHTDLLEDVVGASIPGAPVAVAASAGSVPEPSPPQLDTIFAELLRDLEPMLGVLQSFGYDAVVCLSSLFASELAAASFSTAAEGAGAGRPLRFILSTGEERYGGALACVNAVKRSPGVWFAGSIDRPTFSLITERHVSYEVKNVSRHIFDLDDMTLAALLDGRDTLAVVDRTISDRYDAALSAYAARHINLVGELVIDATEVGKSWPLVERVCEEAIRRGLGREGVIMAVGGGITLDIAGMAASIFRRGIRYVRVPTTLVGMIDAGVGIKQGVNFASKKNLLGSFYAPFGCISDHSFLQTLPRRHLACGVSEMIKIALICDRRLFEILESNAAELLESHFQEPRAAADESILRAQLSMMQQLQSNLFEHDLRRWVDFGHTFSPTLELASRHGFAHGEAVALDMALATAIAVRQSVCDRSVLERMVNLYHAAHLPVYDALCSSDVLEPGLGDIRLHRGGSLNFVVPTDVGTGIFLQEIDGSDIDGAAHILADLELALTGT
jgi:3-dehydroquinate synthetase